MTDIHLYLGLENLALTDPQKLLIVDQLKTLGQRNSGLPHVRNHWRVRPDNDALIFEAVWDDANLTALQMRTWLAGIFGVALAQVTSNLTTPTFSVRQSQVLTFTYQSVARLRSVAFGGVSATREQSRIEALAYLTANAGAWAE